MESFHLLRPWWLLALVPWLLLAWRFWRRDPERGAWGRVCDEALLPHVLDGGAPGRRRLGAALVSLAGALAILALAGPAWRELPQPVYRQQEALVVALDLSRSMDATDLAPSRLARAHLKIRDLIRQRADGQTALVVFAGDAFAVTPLTDDVNTIDALVPSLGTDMMPVPGTRTDRALEVATDLLDQAGVRHGRVVLIADDAGAVGLNRAVERLRDGGHRLSVIGVGTPDGAPIPVGKGGFLKDLSGQIIIPGLAESTLQSLARAGGGRYSRLSVDDRDLAKVLDSTTPGWSSVTDVPGLTSDRWREEGPWLVLLLLPLVSLVFRRGVLGLAVVVVLTLPEPAVALDWKAPWYTDDQRGARSFEAEDYGKAIREFQDAEWKAAALYRAERFQESAALLAGIPHPEALYNRGNALARMGNLEEAKALYEQVLRTDPGHEDARHNLDLLRKLEPPPQPQQQGGGQDGESDRPSPEKSDADSSGGGRSGTSPPEGEGAPEDPGEGDSPPDAGATEQASGEPPPGQEPGQPPPRSENETEDGDPEADALPASSGDDLSESSEASEQAMKQWLRRIQDDPGGLLRRKFRYQYSRRPRDGTDRVEPW